MNLASILTASVTRHPDKVAVYWGEAEYTYRHFDDQSAWVAETLRERFGVRPGDRVGIWLHNCPEYFSAVFGVLRVGAVAVPINNFLKPDEVSHIVADSGVKVVFTNASMGEGVARLQGALPALRSFPVEEFRVGGAITAELVERDTTDLAVLIYTSGTTGRPKGAMLTHGNLRHNVSSCEFVLQAVQVDRFALVLPMFHSFMLTVCLLLPIAVGGSVVLVKSLSQPKNVLQEILQHGATVLPAIPQLFRALAHAPLPPNLPLRLCISGAAPLPITILQEFSARFTIPLIEGYGLSEASPVVSLNPIDGIRKPGSIGLPIRAVEISIRDEEGREVTRGAVGEVCVRGGNVMAGYWNLPEESARAIRDGWLYTGDIGRTDADGYTYITDRKKDMILVNGINVYPREIEEVIYGYPGVKEAAVIGRPDSRKGEQPIAYVVVNDGVEFEESQLHAYLKARLADYKLPRHIVRLPALPRNATGKVLKTALRELTA